MLSPVISRPGEPLEEHAQAVAGQATALVGGDLVDSVETAALLHDLGKASPQFQQYVHEDTEYLGDAHLTYHARLGGLATFHALGVLGASEADRLAGLLAVLRHHGRLPDAAGYLLDVITSEREARADAHAEPQRVALADYEPGQKVADRLLREATDGESDWDGFTTALDDGSLFEAIEALVADRTEGLPDSLSAAGVGVDPDPGGLPIRLYDRSVRLWSGLTLADKACAAGSASDPRLRPKHLSSQALEDRIRDLRATAGIDEDPPGVETLVDDLSVTDRRALNQLREALRRRVRANAETLATTGTDVATLTLPTGLGKTFTGLTAAYTVRDQTTHHELEATTAPRVVYALPYTSIIEQVREEFERTFEADPRGRSFTVHHHLSETVTYPDVEAGSEGARRPDGSLGDEGLRPGQFGEAWRSGTILTTFVQLFESLAGPTNSQGLKLPALEDAVIILDEPQTLPAGWWGAIRYLTRLLTQEYDATVISMTATQPALFTAADLEPASLLAAPDEDSGAVARACFEAVERVRYRVDPSIRDYPDEGRLRTHEAAAALLVGRALEDPSTSTSTLAVCNTIDSATELSTETEEAVRERTGDVRNLGAVYREVLARTADGPPGTDPPSLDDGPDVATLAGLVLEELGFEAETTAEDGDTAVTDRRWRHDGPTPVPVVGTFSSRFRPRDRRVLVSVATVLARRDYPFVLVSTQAVEAGVDISFGRVYRAVAPIDSIVQAAGRCNRSFEWGEGGGEVTVWGLAPTDGATKPPARLVYRPVSRLARATDILTELGTGSGDGEAVLADSTVATEAVPRYYEWADDADLSDHNLTAALETCAATTIGRESLIQDGPETRDVVVAHTSGERRVLERISSLLDSEDPTERARGIDQLDELADLRVSVPVRDLEAVAASFTRLDRQRRNEAGVELLWTTAAGENKHYDLGNGGLRVTDVITDRFSF